MHHRRSIRLPEYDYAQPGAYFVTICAWQKACLFGKIADNAVVLNDFGQIVHEEWAKTKAIRDYVELDEFIVMPNHLHGIIVITGQNNRRGDHGYCRGERPLAPTQPKPQSLGAIIANFKATASKRINGLQSNIGHPIWQRNYYEHVVRNDKELAQIREYIANNPIKWDLDENHPGMNAKKDDIEMIINPVGASGRSPLQLDNQS